MTSLLQELWKSDYSVEDFVTVIMTHYGRSNGSADRDYFGDQDSPSLVLDWNARGTISALQPGPSFDRNDLVILREKLEAALDHSSEIVRRFVVMTARPLTGAVGFEHWFSLLPAPSEAPRPNQDFLGGHPAILEVEVRGSIDGLVTFRRAERKLMELELIFGSITGEHIKRPTRSSQWLWALDPTDHNRSIFVQPSYQFSGFVGEVSDFTDISSFPDVPHLPADDYYQKRWAGGPYVALPETMPALLKRFREMDSGQRSKFLRGAYWATTASDLWQTSKSAAYAAYVQAIEALMPSVSVGDQCELCGNGPARRTRKNFAAFVDEIAGGGLTEKARLAFYDRRSRLVHGDMILDLDDSPISTGGPGYLREMSDQQLLLQVTQVVFHNWLLQQPARVCV